MNNKPSITTENVKSEFESKFIKVYGLEYIKGKQYMNASRRALNDLVAIKDDDEFKSMLPDAVSVIAIINGESPKLLMNYEFRYPVGQYLLSVPAGLIDEEDKGDSEAVIKTAVRELKEETGISVSENDRVEIVNPLLFSTPGMTDESNAVVLAVINNTEDLSVNSDGAVGGEHFEGYELLSKEDAQRILKNGKDDKGIYYSVYSWMALMYFVSDMWK